MAIENIETRRMDFTVKGITELMFGSPTRTPKKDGETFAQHEERIWQEKVKVTKDGQAYMNPFCVTNSLITAARFLARKIPGEGKKTFTDRFTKGVAPHEKVLIFNGDGNALTIENIEPRLLSVPSDGKHGGSKRVERIFPTVSHWSATGSVLVFDGKISLEQFEDHLVAVGRFVGWGSMRVEGGGINGRFDVIKCEEVSLT